MPPSGDDPQTWDVWQRPVGKDELDRYRPPAKDRPDPITLTGQPDKRRRRYRRAARVATLAISFGLSLATMGLRNVTWDVSIAGVVVLLVLGAILIARQAPVWKQPEITVNGENLTVTDVTGVTRTVAWSDIERVHLASFVVGFTEELHLTVVFAGDGEEVAANLGDTLGIHEARKAIAARVPDGLELRVGPRRAVELG
jgi:hypothetical protein